MSVTNDKNLYKPLEEYVGAEPLLSVFRLGLIRASSVSALVCTAFEFVEGWLHLSIARASSALHSVCTAFLVYRFEEDGSLLKEGGGGLPLGALRACSYKTQAED